MNTTIIEDEPPVIDKFGNQWNYIGNGFWRQEDSSRIVHFNTLKVYYLPQPPEEDHHETVT